MKLFHASKHEFDFPDYDQITSNMTGHANGMLGLWVAVKNDWIESFGGVLYEVDLKDPVVRDVTIDELSSWSHHDEEYHKDLRDKYILDGVDFLRLVETDGRSAMGVVVNFDAIESFSRMNGDPQKLRPNNSN